MQWERDGAQKARAGRSAARPRGPAAPRPRPGRAPRSPERAGRRLPHRQAGVEQQRPEAAHGVPARQVREHRPLLHQPRQPRARALADLGARVLELRKGTGSEESSAPAPGLGRSPRPSPAPLRPSAREPGSHLFQQLRRRPVVVLQLGAVLRRCQLGLTVAGGRELRSLEALRPAFAHGGVQTERGRQRRGGGGCPAGGRAWPRRRFARRLTWAGGPPEPTWEALRRRASRREGGGAGARSARAQRGWAGPGLAEGRGPVGFPGKEAGFEW